MATVSDLWTMDKQETSLKSKRALDSALAQIERQFGKVIIEHLGPKGPFRTSRQARHEVFAVGHSLGHCARLAYWADHRDLRSGIFG